MDNSTDDKKEAFIEAIKKYGPILYLIFVFWGLTHEYIYYKLFNIDITKYIDLSEIVLLLYNDAIILCLFICIGMIYCLTIQMFFEIWSTMKTIISFLRKKKREYKASKAGYIITALLLAFLYIINLIVTPPDKINFLSVFGLLTGLLVFLLIISEVKNYTGAIFGLIFPIVTITFLIHSFVKKAETIKAEQKFKIHLTDGQIMTTAKNLRLAGETKEYIFIYNKSDSTTSVINRDKILKIDYK
jgi:hypothetical protein